MTDKFQSLIEFIINDQEKEARDLFHSIVVEKSREIYEELELESGQEVSDDEVGGFIEDVEAEQMTPTTEAEFADPEGEGEDMGDDMGGDDMGDDMGDDDMDDDMGDDLGQEPAELEDRVVDLEDALDELKAEFDQLVGDEGEGEFGDEEGGEGEFGDEVDDEDMGDEEGGEGEFSGEEGEGEETAEEPTESFVREYTEKAPTPVTSEEGGVNKKSVIISKKNDMGGTTANIVKGGGETTRPAPTAKDMGYKGPKEAAKSAFKSNAPKAKTGEEGGVNKKSTI